MAPRVLTKLGRLLGEDVRPDSPLIDITRMIVLLREGHPLYGLAAEGESYHYDASGTDFARWVNREAAQAGSITDHPHLMSRPLGFSGQRHRVTRRDNVGQEPDGKPAEVLSHAEMRQAVITLIASGIKRVCILRNDADYLVWY